MKLVKRLRQLNEALPLLLLGIIMWALLVELVGVWFAHDKIRYSSGVLVGCALAIYMAIDMARVLESAVDRGAGVRILRAKSIIRYLIVVIVFLIMVYCNLGSFIGAFISIVGLKVSAYAQPLINRLFKLDTNNKEEVKM